LPPPPLCPLLLFFKYPAIHGSFLWNEAFDSVGILRRVLNSPLSYFMGTSPLPFPLSGMVPSPSQVRAGLRRCFFFDLGEPPAPRFPRRAFLSHFFFLNFPAVRGLPPGLLAFFPLPREFKRTSMSLVTHLPFFFREIPHFPPLEFFRVCPLAGFHSSHQPNG